jgi:hypothetical protein
MHRQAALALEAGAQFVEVFPRLRAGREGEAAIGFSLHG